MANTGAAEAVVSDGARELTREWVQDYVALLGKVSRAVELVQYDHNAASVAFAESTMGPPGFRTYVERMRLAGLLQRAWMLRMAETVALTSGLLDPWSIFVGRGQTSGNALVNFSSGAFTPGFEVGVQVQYRTVKVFCYPSAYDGTRVQEAEELLDKLAVLAKISGRFNRSRRRGFHSYSAGKAPDGRNINEWTQVVAPIVHRVVLAVARLA